MKTLYVLRHGQAAPETDVDSDHERVLTARGQSEVRRSAEHLRQRSSPPGLILSSSATRAQQSAQLCLQAWPPGPELEIVGDLYLASAGRYLAALAAAAEPHRAVMVVGHNPGLEALVHLLTERSEQMPTASLVEIELGVEGWADLSRAPRGSGRLVQVFRG